MQSVPVRCGKANSVIQRGWRTLQHLNSRRKLSCGTVDSQMMSARTGLSWKSRCLPGGLFQKMTTSEIGASAHIPIENAEPANRPQIRPTPAAALSPNRNHRDDYQLQGVLKVVRNGSKTSDYIKFSGVLGSLTSDVDEATHIRCNSLSSGTLLERMVNFNHIIAPFYD